MVDRTIWITKATWQASARRWRKEAKWWEKQAINELATRAGAQAKVGIQQLRIAQLRHALDSLLRCSAYRELGHCGQCEQRAVQALRATAEYADD